MGISQGSMNPCKTTAFERSVSFTTNNASSKTNEDFACYIGNFLNGDSDRLLSIDVLDYIIKNSRHDNSISIAQGVTVTLEDVRDGLYEIMITYENNYTNTRSRMDKITANTHYTGLCINTSKRETMTDIRFIKDTKKLIDFPLIDEKRIKYLQSYLKKYYEKYGLIDMYEDKASTYKVQHIIKK